MLTSILKASVDLRVMQLDNHVMEGFTDPLLGLIGYNGQVTVKIRRKLVTKLGSYYVGGIVIGVCLPELLPDINYPGEQVFLALTLVFV